MLENMIIIGFTNTPGELMGAAPELHESKRGQMKYKANIKVLLYFI